MKSSLFLLARSFSAAVLIFLTALTKALEPAEDLSILPTPPMGVDIWYRSGPYFTEDTIKEAVDIASTNGLVELGWKYIMITDGWQGSARVNGELLPDPAKIPNITNLIDYVHSRGMKIGIYSEPTPNTSAGFIGSGGYIEQDAATFARWGVDYVQFDMGLVQGGDDQRYAFLVQFHDALRAATTNKIPIYTTGFRTIRPDAFALLNCMRVTGDLGYGDNGEGPLGEMGIWEEYLHHIDKSTTAPQLVGPGHWMHTDHTPMVLPFPTSNRAYFSMNAMIASPIFSDYLYPTYIDPYGYTLFTNREIISIHQDRLGRQAQPVWQQGHAQVWSKMLADGSRAVAFFNRSTNQTLNFTLNWEDIGLKPDTRAQVRDCWLHADLGIKTNSFSMAVGSTTAEIFRVTPLARDPNIYVRAATSASPQIVVSGQILNYCTLHRSTDLREWTPVTRLKNTSGSIQFTDAAQAGAGPTFYRALAE